MQAGKKKVVLKNNNRNADEEDFQDEDDGMEGEWDEEEEAGEEVEEGEEDDEVDGQGEYDGGLQHFQFSNLDDEGAASASSATRQKQRKKRSQSAAVKTPRRTIKASDRLNIHSKGSPIVRDDKAIVKVNLAKFAMAQISAEEIEEDSALVDGMWRCLVPSNNPQHQELHMVGTNTGNLMKHMTTHHEKILDGLRRLVQESAKEEIETKCREYIADLKAPTQRTQQSMSRFIHRVERAGSVEISAQAAAVVWFTDAQIPFAQFDNDLFKQFCEKVGQVQNEAIQLGSARTMTEVLLPQLYGFCVEKMQQQMASWKAFFVTFDGWKRHGRKFVSQTYHGICASTFTYSQFLLDLIEMRTEKFEETLAATLQFRQETWCHRFPDLLVAGGLADAAANMQAAGRSLFADDPDDFSRCMCHQIQLVWKDARGTGQAGKDLCCLEDFLRFVVDNSALAEALRIHQIVNVLDASKIVLPNDTRWEGQLLCVKRALELKESLMAMAEMDGLNKWREQVVDFLDATFFRRLQGYVAVMETLNRASRLFQTESFPTGCFVPFVVLDFESQFREQNLDPSHVAELKRALIRASKVRLSWICRHEESCSLDGPCHCVPSLFLRAAFFHPGVWNWICNDDAEQVDFRLRQRVANVVVEETLNLMTDLKGRDDLRERRQERVKTDVFEYLERCKDATNVVDWEKLKMQGEFGGVNHMEFWKGVAVSPPHESIELKGLLCVASMFLAVPGAEAADERSFSSTGGTLTKFRTQLLNATIEQLTVVRMYVKRCSISLLEFDKQVQQLVENKKSKEKM